MKYNISISKLFKVQSYFTSVLHLKHLVQIILPILVSSLSIALKAPKQSLLILATAFFCSTSWELTFLTITETSSSGDPAPGLTPLMLRRLLPFPFELRLRPCLVVSKGRLNDELLELTICGESMIVRSLDESLYGKVGVLEPPPTSMICLRLKKVCSK